MSTNTSNHILDSDHFPAYSEPASVSNADVGAVSRELATAEAQMEHASAEILLFSREQAAVLTGAPVGDSATLTGAAFPEAKNDNGQFSGYRTDITGRPKQPGSPKFKPTLILHAAQILFLRKKAEQVNASRTLWIGIRQQLGSKVASLKNLLSVTKTEKEQDETSDKITRGQVLSELESGPSST